VAVRVARVWFGRVARRYVSLKSASETQRKTPPAGDLEICVKSTSLDGLKNAPFADSEFQKYTECERCVCEQVLSVESLLLVRSRGTVNSDGRNLRVSLTTKAAIPALLPAHAQI